MQGLGVYTSGAGASVGGHDYFLDGAQQPFRPTFPRWRISSGSTANMATGVMLSAAVVLYAGDVITKLLFRSGNTPATPTNWWFALYDTQATPALVAWTGDQGAGAWGAATVKDLAITKDAAGSAISSYSVVTTGVYRIGVMVAGTVPTLVMGDMSNNGGGSAAMVTGQAVLAETSGSGLTTTPPATVAAPTVVQTIPYAIAH